MNNFCVYVVLGTCLLCTSAYSEISVVDDWGRSVELQKPASKIVSLSPHLTELVSSVGAQDALIGVTRHCDYPASVRTLPKISDYQLINYEMVRMLHPELILLWGAGAQTAVINKLETLGFVVYISQPKTFDDIANNLIAIGKLTGNSQKAILEGERFIKNMSGAVRTSYRPKLLYLVWDSPPMGISDNNWIAHIITYCGAINMFGDSKSAYPILNREILVQAPIDLLVHSIDSFDEDKAHTLLKRKTEVMYIEADLLQRPSLRLSEGKTRLCEKISQIRSRMKSQS